MRLFRSVLRRVRHGLRRQGRFVRRHKILAATVTTVIVALLLIVPSAMSANAATGIDFEPADLAVGVPSSVIHAMGGSGLSDAQLANAMRYSPKVSTAVSDFQDGKITKSTFDEIVAGEKWKFPATVKVTGEGLGKGAGNAAVWATAITGYNGARWAQSTMLGMDRDGVLCSAQAGGGFNGFLASTQMALDDTMDGGIYGHGCGVVQGATDEQIQQMLSQVTMSVSGEIAPGVVVTSLGVSTPRGAHQTQFICVAYKDATRVENIVTWFRDVNGVPHFSGNWVGPNPSLPSNGKATEDDCSAFVAGQPWSLIWWQPVGGTEDPADSATFLGWSPRGASGPVAEVTEQTAPSRGVTRFKCDGSDEWHEIFGQVTNDPTEVEPVSPEFPDDCDVSEVSVGTQQEVPKTGWTDVGTPRVAETPRVVRDWSGNYPQCVNGGCRLELRKLVNGTEVDCFSDPDQCLSWRSEADQAEYRCYYGGGQVDLSECNIYGTTFDRRAVQQGQGYANPETGKQPDWNPSTDAPASSRPEVNPGAGTQYANEPVTDPDQQPRQCFPQGWGVFNPFEWVFQPVKCALEWAFVPRQSVLREQITGVRTSWDDTPPAVISRRVSTLPAVFESTTASGCSGPGVSFTIPFMKNEASVDAHPLDACDGAMASLASISKVVVGGLAILGTLFALTRIAGNVVNAGGLGQRGSKDEDS